MRSVFAGGPNFIANQLPPGTGPARPAPAMSDRAGLSTTKPVNGGDAIARLFNPDVFGNRRLPNMPGQRVMTVDEIERASAAAAGPASAAN